MTGNFEKLPLSQSLITKREQKDWTYIFQDITLCFFQKPFLWCNVCFVNSQPFLTQKVNNQCMNCNMIAWFITLPRKDIILFAEVFQKYFFRLFFGTLQLVVFIPTGSLEPRSSPRGDFGPHSTHIIIWQCSLVDCNSKQLHTPCDNAQITTMMMTKIDRDERYAWFTESSMRSKIRFQGFPVSRNFPQNCNQLNM